MIRHHPRPQHHLAGLLGLLVASFLTFLSLLWSFFLANFILLFLAGACVVVPEGAVDGSAANAVNANVVMIITMSCFILVSFVKLFIYNALGIDSVDTIHHDLSVLLHLHHQNLLY